MVLRVTEEKEAGRSSPVTFFKDSVGIQQSKQNGIKETSHLIWHPYKKQQTVLSQQDSTPAEYQCQVKLLYNLQAEAQKASDLVSHLE